MQIVPGIVVGEKYQIEAPLARGGMGSVWVARHVKLGSTVAVKFLDADVAAASGAIARFEREARAAATLDTPHVVRVHDYGVESGTPYLVMELLRGEDLNTRLRKRRRLPLPEAARIVAQMGRALRRAHEAGIVHRDLKPANVYLARVEDDEVVKILDFGIAKETWSRVEDSTKTGEVFGSPHYMSPEQTRAQKTVDRRADVWATGVILYRMITGRLPFPGDVLGEILSSVLVDPVPPIAEVAPDLPPALDAFFARALAKKKEERFGTIDELVDAFSAIAGASADRASSAPDGRALALATPLPAPAPLPGAPAPPFSAAHADTLLTIGGAGTIDTGAATLPYRPAAPAREPLPSTGAEAHTAMGGTGPSIAGAASSLLPPELAPRRSRVVAAVVALAVATVAGVVVLAVSVLSPGESEPSAPSASAGAPPEASPAASTTGGMPSVRVEPAPSADTPAPPVDAPATATSASATASPAGANGSGPAAPATVTATKPAAATSAPGGSWTSAPAVTAAKAAAAATAKAPASTPTSTKKPAAKSGKPDPDWGL